MSYPPAQNRVRMKNIILTEQMELGLDQRARATVRRRSRRDGEATSRWWFAQMRRVVKRAVDWQPKAQPRPMQERLALNM